jgi:hypothetical protein
MSILAGSPVMVQVLDCVVKQYLDSDSSGGPTLVVMDDSYSQR